MNPQAVFCTKNDCTSRGLVGAGNIGIKSQKERRYFCKTCGRTFAETTGLPLFDLKKSQGLFFLVVPLLAYGCPPQAIVHAFGLDERTVFAVRIPLKECIDSGGKSASIPFECAHRFRSKTRRVSPWRETVV